MQFEMKTNGFRENVDEIVDLPSTSINSPGGEAASPYMAGGNVLEISWCCK